MKKISVWKNLLLWLIVIAIFALFMKPHHAVSTEGFDGKLTVQGNSGYTIQIAYDQITGIELRDNLGYGILVSGVNQGKEMSGIWENEELGEYHLCINTTIDSCIIVYIGKEIYVVNYESERSTKSMYTAILEQM